MVCGALVLLFLYRRRNEARRKQEAAEFSAQVADTEMKALRSQMNPHFIFNSLNSISDYILKNNLAAADDYLVKFASLMRLVLENSEKKQVPLADDLKALELYMQLESLRLKHRFAYEIRVDAQIDRENTLIPPLILQPFVENSIWHGFAGKDEPGRIIVTIEKDGGMIRCIVDDDGVGLGKPAGGRKSLGMRITTSRIEILNKTKKANASVRVFPLPQGTRAEVRLPLELGF